MKNKVFLKFDSENSYLYNFILACIPLILYGFYKNGILPLLARDISFLSVINPFLFPIVGVLIGIFVDYIIWWKNDSDVIWTHYPIYGLIVGMVVPININIIIFGILLFLIFIFLKKLNKITKKINPCIISIVIILLISNIVGGISYANASEGSHQYIYGLIAIFFGKSIGGIATTSIFWMLLGYLYLSFDSFYKKEIPIYILATYFLLTFLFELIFPTGNMIKSLLNPSIFFASIYLATSMKYSPYLESERIIYGIGIGIVGFLLCCLFPVEGIFISILIMQFLHIFLHPLMIYLQKHPIKIWKRTKKMTSFVELPKLNKLK